MNEKLKQCTIILTRNCNLRCDFCFAKKAGYNTNDTIDYDDLKRIVDFCCDSDVQYIFFTGGEPLTYPKLIDILQYVKSKNTSIETAVATNGILLEDPTFCKELTNCGLGYIDISMKGSNSQEWKKTTGYDGTEKQLHAIHNIASLPIPFTCSMVITQANVTTFCDAVRSAYDNGARQFSFTFIIDNNNVEENGQNYLRVNNPFKLVESFLSQTDSLNAITTEWWIEYSFPLCVYTDEQLNLLKGKLASPCQVHMKNAVTFNTKMELLPCDMYIDQKIGTLGRNFSTYQQFQKYTDSGVYCDTLNKIREYPSEKCTSCQHLEYCYGGCPVLWKNYSFEELLTYKQDWLQLQK